MTAHDLDALQRQRSSSVLLEPPMPAGPARLDRALSVGPDDREPVDLLWAMIEIATQRIPLSSLEILPAPEREGVPVVAQLHRVVTRPCRRLDHRLPQRHLTVGRVDEISSIVTTIACSPQQHRQGPLSRRGRPTGAQRMRQQQRLAYAPIG